MASSPKQGILDHSIKHLRWVQKDTRTRHKVSLIEFIINSRPSMTSMTYNWRCWSNTWIHIDVQRWLILVNLCGKVTCTIHIQWLLLFTVPLHFSRGNEAWFSVFNALSSLERDVVTFLSTSFYVWGNFIRFWTFNCLGRNSVRNHRYTDEETFFKSDILPLPPLSISLRKHLYLRSSKHFSF